MRVISGDLGGRTLRTPPGRDLRPSQGHVRQVLFDIVGSGIVGARVLDLFAGVGALGIEALSRGAASACFVERDAVAVRYLTENVEGLGLGGRSRVLTVSVELGFRILETEGESFGWVFADPPYRLAAGSWLLRLDRSGPGGILDRSGTLVMERSRRNAGAEAVGRLTRVRTRTVGETNLEFFRWGGVDGTTGDLSGDV